jgi:hypothetical protein
LSTTKVEAASEDTMRGRVDELRQPDPGSVRAKAGLPASRDFR